MRPDSTDTRADGGVALVTGGAGFIGSHLVDRLVDRGDRVVVLDDLSSANLEYLNPAAEFANADIRSGAIESIVRGVEPTTVFHLAAQGSVAVSAKDPRLDIDVNVHGSMNLLDAVRGLEHRPRVVYFSTGGAIYGEPDASELPVDETFHPKPVSTYGASKLAVENYLRVYGNLFGLNYAIVRPANVYGPRQNPHGEAGVIAIFTQAMLETRPLTIFGDGDDERDYVYIDDFIDGVLALADSNLPGPYNLGSGVGVSVNDIHRTLTDLIPNAEPPSYGPPRAGDIPKIALDSDAAAADLGWTAETPFENGVEQTVAWFRNLSR